MAWAVQMYRTSWACSRSTRLCRRILRLGHVVRVAGQRVAEAEDGCAGEGVAGEEDAPDQVGGASDRVAGHQEGVDRIPPDDDGRVRRQAHGRGRPLLQGSGGFPVPHYH
jgi:hypothetical protein